MERHFIGHSFSSCAQIRMTAPAVIAKFLGIGAIALHVTAVPIAPRA